MKKINRAVLSLALIGTISYGTNASAETIKVKSGDTLWKISNELKINVSDLKKENKLTSNIIFVGQKLNIPINEKENKGEVNYSSENKEDHLLIHKVKHGEYLYKIAKKYGVTYKDIAKWSELSSYVLYTGQELIVSEPLGVSEKEIHSKEKEIVNTTDTHSKTDESVASPSRQIYKTHNVKHGEYLYKIGKKYGVSYKDIAKWNDLSSYMLYTGQELIVSEPVKSNKEETVKEEKGPAVEKTTYNKSLKNEFYTVKSGDYLYKIAKKHDLTVNQLKEMNRLSSNIIYTGQTFIVEIAENPIFMKPSKGNYSSSFGERWGSHHNGVDIAMKGDRVTVSAAADGLVKRSYLSESYGNVVFIEHEIDGNIYETVYAHMKNREVKEGDTVKQGDFLGYMGNTGKSFGQHLHFEIHEGNWDFEKTNAVDPLKYIY